MSQERLKAELLEAKKEIERLKERASKSSTRTVNKDLSLISDSKMFRLRRYGNHRRVFRNYRSAAKVGRWNENDRQQIAVLRLTGYAKLFYKCCD